MLHQKHYEDNLVISSTIREYAFWKIVNWVQPLYVRIAQRNGKFELQLEILSNRCDNSKISLKQIAVDTAIVLYLFELLGIVHADIKPENIVYKYFYNGQESKAYLIDFDHTQIIQPFSEYYSGYAPKKGKAYTNAYRIGDPDKTEAGTINTENDIFAYEITMRDMTQMVSEYLGEAQDLPLDTLAKRGDLQPCHSSFGTILEKLGHSEDADKIVQLVKQNELLNKIEKYLDTIDILDYEECGVLYNIMYCIADEEKTFIPFLESLVNQKLKLDKDIVAVITDGITGTAIYCIDDILCLEKHDYPMELIVEIAEIIAYPLCLIAACISQRMRNKLHT